MCYYGLKGLFYICSFQYAQSAPILKSALWMVPLPHANVLKATMMATLEIVLKT